MSSSAAVATERCKEEEDVIKPGVHVTLKVQDMDGRRVYLTMRQTEKLQGLMDYYYASVSSEVTYGTGRFLYDGRRLRSCQTPAEFRMEDGDVVDFFKELDGGDDGWVAWSMPA